MASVAVAQSPSPSAAAGRYDRLFYGSLAIVMAIVVFAGFAPTYYLQLYNGSPVTFSGSRATAITHLHGVLFTGWVLLFIAQTALIAGRRVQLHRRLGIAGGILAAAMVVVGTTTAVSSAARGGAPPGVDPLAFLAVPLFDMPLFGGFVAAALWHRRNKEAHKRLMLLAYVSLLAAPVARLPGLLPLGPLVFFGLAFIPIAAGAAYDRMSRGRVHAAYKWGGAVLVLSVPVRLAVSGTAAWRGLAEFLTS